MPVTIALPVLAFVANSGTGKTTLLKRLIPELRVLGVRCAIIKHSHHDFEIDVPGKDSHVLRQAGAEQVLLASPHRTFWVREGDGESEPTLSDLIRRLDHSTLDLILVEGYRGESIPKIEVYRPVLGRPLLALTDPAIVAVASDGEIADAGNITRLPLNEPSAVAAFVVGWMRESAPRFTQQQLYQAD